MEKGLRREKGSLAGLLIDLGPIKLAFTIKLQNRMQRLARAKARRSGLTGKG
jgi:hypothetical protein